MPCGSRTVAISSLTGPKGSLANAFAIRYGDGPLCDVEVVREMVDLSGGLL